MGDALCEMDKYKRLGIYDDSAYTFMHSVRPAILARRSDNVSSSSVDLTNFRKKASCSLQPSVKRIIVGIDSEVLVSVMAPNCIL